MTDRLDEIFSIYFAGDSGDGIQLIGQRLTFSCMEAGWQIQVMPDFPAEIRAPQGTLAGVSGYQLSASSHQIEALADSVDVLVAFNVAAIKQSLPHLKSNGLLIYNESQCGKKDFKKANIAEKTLEELIPAHVQSVGIDITTQTTQAVADVEVSHSEKKKAKNFYALGMIHWFLQINLNTTQTFIVDKFQSSPMIAEANTRALNAGYNFALTMEIPHWVKPMVLEDIKLAGELVSGYKAIKLALAFMTVKTQLPMLVTGYPITPASNILHDAAKLADFGVSLFQAEDEIAAACAALGASFAGRLAATCTSGPGLDLKSETLGLAVMSELPMVVINVQRAGPSTGLPTKTEQSDLMTAVYGRHGEAPLPVLSASTPEDIFYSLIESFRLAVNGMTPVILLLDAQSVNAAQRWQLPNFSEISFPEITFSNGEQNPYDREEGSLKRPWIVPGTAEGMHRLGGLEKGDEKGSVSYAPDVHQNMISLRHDKVNQLLCKDSYQFYGETKGSLLIVSWGSTFGVIRAAIESCCRDGLKVGHLHVRQLYPLPDSLSDVFKDFANIMVAELNTGQLIRLLRDKFLINAKAINQVSGQPFRQNYLESYFRGAL